MTLFRKRQERVLIYRGRVTHLHMTTSADICSRKQTLVADIIVDYESFTLNICNWFHSARNGVSIFKIIKFFQTEINLVVGLGEYFSRLRCLNACNNVSFFSCKTTSRSILQGTKKNNRVLCIRRKILRSSERTKEQQYPCRFRS